MQRRAAKKEVILVHPREGNYGLFYERWLPLSVLSLTGNLQKAGWRVRVFDQRFHRDWRRQLSRLLGSMPAAVGMTTMVGTQIRKAIEISRFVKSAGNIPVIWGGIHPSLFPESIVGRDFADAAVLGEGEVVLPKLVKRLAASANLTGIHGVGYMLDRKLVISRQDGYLDLDSLPEPAYETVPLKRYLHRYFGEDGVMEIESSRGCPNFCGFCYSPLYSNRRWRAQSAGRVVERLEFISRKHGVRAFHFIEDGFFTDMKRVREIFEGILHKGLNLRLGFQGMQADILARMSAEELDLMYLAGTRFFQVGVESGSERLRAMVGKKVDETKLVMVNRKLGKFHGLYPYYNFICGLPSETEAELRATARLASRLLVDNPNTMISPFHQFKPYPGTAMAPKSGNMPKTLEDWAACDFGDVETGTGSASLRRKLRLLSIFADSKLVLQSKSRLASLARAFYGPAARFRLNHEIYSLMPEERLFRMVTGR